MKNLFTNLMNLVKKEQAWSEKDQVEVSPKRPKMIQKIK